MSAERINDVKKEYTFLMIKGIIIGLVFGANISLLLFSLLFSNVKNK